MGGRRGGPGEYPLRAADRTLSASRLRRGFPLQDARVPYDVRNGSGTAGVCAFVSYGGQGRFCLTAKGQANPQGQGGAHDRLPLQCVEAQVCRTGFFKMDFFFLPQMFL